MGLRDVFLVHVLAQPSQNWDWVLFPICVLAYNETRAASCVDGDGVIRVLLSMAATLRLQTLADRKCQEHAEPNFLRLKEWEECLMAPAAHVHRFTEHAALAITSLSLPYARAFAYTVLHNMSCAIRRDALRA
jgi:hypothetical protein